MIGHKAATGWAAIFFAGSSAACSAAFLASIIAWASPASAQTFDSYRCADGTHFILAFYPRDHRAYLQIDGRAVTLKKSLTVSGKRYAGGGVSLVMTAAGVLIRHVRRSVTACELS